MVVLLMCSRECLEIYSEPGGARAAGVPIVMSYLDYSHKRGGFGPALLPSGDVRADMDEIRDFYSDKVGLYPEKFGEVRLKEEM